MTATKLKLPLSAPQSREVADAARAGKLIIFPTDTVYGVGSAHESAEEKIYQVKGRPLSKALPILHANLESVKRSEALWTPLADDLAKQFWPGALTLVLKKSSGGTVAVRVPDHPGLQELIALTGRPWLSTSANLSGKPAVRDVIELPGVDYVLDGGRTRGTESTVVDATGERPVILRQGAITL